MLLLSMKSSGTSYNSKIKLKKKIVESIKNSPEHLGQLEIVIKK